QWCTSEAAARGCAGALVSRGYLACIWPISGTHLACIGPISGPCFASFCGLRYLGSSLGWNSHGRATRHIGFAIGEGTVRGETSPPVGGGLDPRQLGGLADPAAYAVGL